MLRLLAFTLKVTIALPIAAIIVAALIACLAVKVLPHTPDPKRARVRRTAVEDAEVGDEAPAAEWRPPELNLH